VTGGCGGCARASRAPIMFDASAGESLFYARFNIAFRLAANSS